MSQGGKRTALEARLSRLALAEAGREPPELIEEAMADADPAVRIRASRAAAIRLDPERLIEMIERGESLACRASAMDALAAAGEKVIPAIVAALSDGCRGAVLFLLQVLGRIRSPASVALLRSTAHDPDPMLAQAALESLAHQHDTASLPLFIDALHAEPWIAFTAIDALGELGDPRAVDPLLKVREDEIYGDAARAALERISVHCGLGGASA
jgi:HEAT repeat protein